MRRRLVTAIAAATLAGCQPQANTTLSPTAPARFEIRDFKLNEQTNEYGSLNVSGRGTLVALDESLKKGNFLVWLTTKKAHRPDEDINAVLILRDGLATIETSDYVSKEDKGRVNVRYTDWKITGYIPFQEAVLVQENAASAPQK